MDTVTPDVVEDVDLHELLGSLSEPACEYGHEHFERQAEGDPCTKGADWILMTSCDDTAYLCTPHAASVKRRTVDRGLYCSRHDNRRVLVRWELLS